LYAAQLALVHSLLVCKAVLLGIFKTKNHSFFETYNFRKF